MTNCKVPITVSALFFPLFSIISICTQGGIEGETVCHSLTSLDGHGTSPDCYRAVSQLARPRWADSVHPPGLRASTATKERKKSNMQMETRDMRSVNPHKDRKNVLACTMTKKSASLSYYLRFPLYFSFQINVTRITFFLKKIYMAEFKHGSRIKRRNRPEAQKRGEAKGAEERGRGKGEPCNRTSWYSSLLQ